MQGNFSDFTVVVVGAGLAGALMARTLADRGISVCVVDVASAPFSGGASHHHACALYPLIHAVACVEDQFFLMAYRAALNTYRGHSFFHPAPLRLPPQKRFSPLWQDHIDIRDDGAYLADSGWINPIEACHYYLSGIPVFWGVQVTDVHLPTNAKMIIAAGAGTSALYPHLLCRFSAGQTDYALVADEKRNIVTCDDGFIIPLGYEKNQAIMASGGTYRPYHTVAPILGDDTVENLAKLGPSARPYPPMPPTSGVRMRGKTVLPYVGYWGEEGAFVSVLTCPHDSFKHEIRTGILSGFGSRGMVSIPWSVAHLAQWI